MFYIVKEIEEAEINKLIILKENYIYKMHKTSIG